MMPENMVERVAYVLWENCPDAFSNLLVSTDRKTAKVLFERLAVIAIREMRKEPLGPEEWSIERLIDELNDPYGDNPADAAIMKRAAEFLQALAASERLSNQPRGKVEK